MSDLTEVLEVAKREEVGSRATQKLRRDGRVPAVLYGHGEQNEHLSIPAKQVQTLIRHHSKTVELAGDIKDTALVSDIQWDPLGIDVLHLDLIRVNLKELVEVTVPVETHGEAPGTREGGVLIVNLHEVDIRCPAGSIPDSIGLDVREMHMGDQLIVGNLELPEKVELITPEETVVAHVEEPQVEPEETDEEGAGVGEEPEVIAKGGDKDDEEEGGAGS